MVSYYLNYYVEAIYFFNEAIQLNPSHTYSFYWRGMAKFHQQQYAEAIVDFDAAIRLNPTDAQSNGYTYFWRGLAKKQIGDSDAARADFDIALMCAQETRNDRLEDLINTEL